MGRRLTALFTVQLCAGTAQGAREPGLTLVDLPHSDFHLPTGAGTDAIANHASRRGPVGLTRVFLDAGGRLDQAAALATLKAGHGLSSNGPLRLDQYPHVTTHPVWLGDHVLAPGAREDAAWFAPWMKRVIEAGSTRDVCSTAATPRATLEYLQQARDACRTLASTAAPSSVLP